LLDKLNIYKQNYIIFEKECLAALIALEKFKLYLKKPTLNIYDLLLPLFFKIKNEATFRIDEQCNYKNIFLI